MTYILQTDCRYTHFLDFLQDPSVGSGFSFLDPDSIDMKKFPRIAKVPWTYASLYPGDCIFIPSGLCSYM